MDNSINNKSTKTQILDAYEALLKQVSESKQEKPKQIQEEKKQSEITKKVEHMTNESIVSELGELKNKLGKSLELVESSLFGEFKKLDDIRNAIAVEKQNLQDLYQLSTTTDSLAAMLLVQKQQKEQFDADMKAQREAFEADMKQKRAEWKAAQENQAEEDREYNENLKKKRKREEEEYQYALKIARQKDADDYSTKKAKSDAELAEKLATFNKEIADREARVALSEKELTELRQATENFPKELQKALAAQEKQITEKLQAGFDFESKLLAKQNEGDLRLKDQTIASLKEKISEMQQQINQLTEKSNLAERNVKDIAIKAIESTSKIQLFPTGKPESDSK